MRRWCAEKRGGRLWRRGEKMEKEDREGEDKKKVGDKLGERGVAKRR